MLSEVQKLASLNEADRLAVMSELSEDECAALLMDWRGFLARPEQLAPEGNWDVWLALAGRGWGKTRTGSEWIRELVETNSARRIALVAETHKDLVEVMAEGDSGLLNVCPPGLITNYTKKPFQIDFKNGAKALGYNATQPGQLRGPQFDAAWCDEVAKWRYARETWDQLQFGLRIGDAPRVLVTTTPRPIELVKKLVTGEEGEVIIVRGRTQDNLANLSKRFIERTLKRYGGTRLGRQELDGEILGDIPNALWTYGGIELSRVRDVPDQLGRTYVSIDPAAKNNPDSDEHGIIAGAISMDGDDAYILEDGSIKGSPAEWAKQAIKLHDKWEADGIVVEVNQGGDMVAHTIRSVRREIKIIEVHAWKGKHLRAEPVSSLYEQGKVHHVGAFPELETQMTQMTTHGYEGDNSPDRLDAMVHLLTCLFPAIALKRKKDRVRPVVIPIKMPMARR